MEGVEVDAFAIMMKGLILSGKRPGLFDIVCECWYRRHLERLETSEGEIILQDEDQTCVNHLISQKP